MKKGAKFKTTWNDIKNEVFTVKEFQTSNNSYEKLEDVPHNLQVWVIVEETGGDVLLKNIIWI